MAALAAAVLVDTALDRALPAHGWAALLAWLAAAIACASWPGRHRGTSLVRRGDEWYLVARRDAGSPGGNRAADDLHDALTLHAPRYRSGWLLVLEFRDAGGRGRTLEVWPDAVSPADFSYLHLACLFDAAAVRGRGAPSGTGSAR